MRCVYMYLLLDQIEILPSGEFLSSLLVESELVRMKVILYSTFCLLFVEYDDSFEAFLVLLRTLFHLH